jgi:tetratricopeptide (TPR) repeat protein
MRFKYLAGRVMSVAFSALFFTIAIPAQAPPSIQIFMPDGSLPPREIRLSLTSDGGLVETYFTDSKGRFLLTRKEGLKPDAAYTVTVTSDGRSFATTTQSFKLYGVYYIPIFLRALEEAKPNPAGVIDIGELEAQVPEAARNAFDKGNAAMTEGRASEAIERFQQAIHIYPKYFRALNDLGVLLIRLDKIDEAAKTFEQASAIAPHIYYPRLNLAIIKTRQGQYKEAVEILEKIQKDHPHMAAIRTALADALMAMNRLDEAQVHLRAALEEKNLPPQAKGNIYYQLGLLHNRQQKYEEAAQELATALKSLPNAPRIHLQLGAALLELNRPDEAESNLRTAYQLGGVSLGGAQFLLGNLYFLQKKYNLAKQAFEQYLADVPKAPNRAEVASVIEKIKAATALK